MKRRKTFQHPDQLELGLLFEAGGNAPMDFSSNDEQAACAAGSGTGPASEPAEPHKQDKQDKQDKQNKQDKQPRRRRRRAAPTESEPEFAQMHEMGWQALELPSLPGPLADEAEAAFESEAVSEPQASPEAAPAAPELESSEPADTSEPGMQEPRLWSDGTWTVRIITHEAGGGWAAEIHKSGESEAALVCPWEVDREKNPRPLDGSAFDMLVKTAVDMRRRQERQLLAMLHKSVTVQTRSALITVTLDIVPDEDDAHALLAATDDTGTQLAEVRVAPGFKLSQRVATAWVDSGYRKVERV